MTAPYLCRLLAISLFVAATASTPAVAQEMAGWYPFQPTNTLEAGVIGMADWLETPAGKHGRIERRDAELTYNGKPIKLWGLNLCFAACAPEKPLAQRRADFYAKYGINAVRLHKFADGTGWAGIQSAQSAADYDPQGLDRMDYQIACLKQAGIFVKLSAHFGTIKLGPADRRDVPYMDEFGELDGRRDRISAPHSALFYSPQLQQLHLRQMTNLLAHRNPYTGLTYAEDPAIFAIEMINEQSILFFTSMQPLKQSPTLRNNVAARFSHWLERKYGDQAGLVAAWGQRALDSFASEGMTDGQEHLPSLLQGQFALNERVVQGGDQKQFEGQQIPSAALAAVRTVVSFTEQPEDTADFELTAYQRDGAIESSTKELRWSAGDTESTSGYFTIDTPRTQAVVGFAEGATQRLQDLTITSQSPFAAIYVTAQGQQDDLKTGHRLLVVALARARNTGMQFNREGNRLLEKGQPPILLEPVKATIQLNRAGGKVYRLDHDGLQTEHRLAVDQNSFTIDGRRDQTSYYLIEFGAADDEL